MKDHPNTVANRRAHLDQLADDIAAALAPHGFADQPRTDDDAPRCIQHDATRTTIVIDLSGASLGFYVAGRGTTSRQNFHHIRLGHSTRGLPLTAPDVAPIVFLARTLVAEFTVEDAIKADAQHGAVA
ncbi:hypothetical protein [Amycolatopsis kentuckyensis]|uniref:hypothetical protein n=1 Tax=Amycolatopsis kentuckyensis TaxID=218823 RepID=UPI003564285D